MPSNTKIEAQKTDVVLSIIIVSWNTCSFLDNCLHSLQEEIANSSSIHCIETFVVDNASSDGSAQMVLGKYPWVKLIRNDENIGFATANNQVLKETYGHYILLLNPDTIVRDGAINKLLNFITKCPDVGAIGPKVLNADGSLQTSCYLTPTLFREFWRLFHLDYLWPRNDLPKEDGGYFMEHWRTDEPRVVDGLLGACLLLRREALDQVGVFDEDYFMYSEEVDLCYRISKKGWQIYWVPQAEIVHYGRQSTKQVAPQMFLQLYKGKVLYFRKHHGSKAASAYKLILLTASLARLVSVSVLLLRHRSSWRKQMSWARDYLRLIVQLPKM